MEVGPQSQNRDALVGPTSRMLVYMDPYLDPKERPSFKNFRVPDHDFFI